ncbi:MAG TPA: hypothetical protein VEX86_03030 [Longimicrobium sp.]|nr:hypothetical protein [Longimicrobium sp.]
MFIQHVLKGIHAITDADADRAMTDTGILSNWWRRVGQISPAEKTTRLTEDELEWHLGRYDDFHPASGMRFGDNSPFISTTAGTVERDAWNQRNLLFPPLITALRFATDDFAGDGHLFYAYVFVLGKKSVELEGFAEETRDLHVYSGFQLYHPEGELAAKVSIPPQQVERWERYHGPLVLDDLRAGQVPRPVFRSDNPHYQRPERFHNLRPLMV